MMPLDHRDRANRADPYTEPNSCFSDSSDSLNSLNSLNSMKVPLHLEKTPMFCLFFSFLFFFATYFWTVNERFFCWQQSVCPQSFRRFSTSDTLHRRNRNDSVNVGESSQLEKRGFGSLYLTCCHNEDILL